MCAISSQFLPIAALATALVSPAWAVDVSEFQKMNDELAAQFAKADAAAISQMYSTDATVLPPGSDMVKGRENIEKLWKGAIDGMTDVKITTKEVLPLGTDAVREIGTFAAVSQARMRTARWHGSVRLERMQLR
jgi:ketosteroid isomerase-like protein